MVWNVATRLVSFEALVGQNRHTLMGIWPEGRRNAPIIARQGKAFNREVTLKWHKMQPAMRLRNLYVSTS